MTKPKIQENPQNQRSSRKRQIQVVLADIRSRENVGSIFRTADAVGVSKIFLCGITPTPTPTAQFSVINLQFSKQSQTKESDKIAKTALGAEKTVPWEYHKQTWRLLQQLKKEGYIILMLEQTPASKNIFEYRNLKSRRRNESKKLSDGQGKMASKISDKNDIILVLGNEVTGISQKLLDYATSLLQIPMYGKKESLNVAVAFGIAAYTLRDK